MQLISSIVTLGSLASTAIAVSEVGFEFPDSVPMSKRQTDGPSYECHADCGFAVRGSREDGYCDDDEWLELFNGCLDCALEFDIWQHYGDSLSEAAEECGLDATPKPADGDDEPESSAPSTATATSAVESTEVPVTSIAEATSTEISTPSTSEGVSSTTWASSLVPTTTGHANTTTPTPTDVPDNGASQNWGSHILAGGAAIILAANLM